MLRRAKLQDILSEAEGNETVLGVTTQQSFRDRLIALDQHKIFDGGTTDGGHEAKGKGAQPRLGSSSKIRGYIYASQDIRVATKCLFFQTSDNLCHLLTRSGLSEATSKRGWSQAS